MYLCSSPSAISRITVFWFTQTSRTSFSNDCDILDEDDTVLYDRIHFVEEPSIPNKVEPVWAKTKKTLHVKLKKNITGKTMLKQFLTAVLLKPHLHEQFFVTTLTWQFLFARVDEQNRPIFVWQLYLLSFTVFSLQSFVFKTKMARVDVA